MALSDILYGFLSGDDSDGGETTGDADATDATKSDVSVATDGTEAIVYECRECGTTVSRDTDVCPTCDSSAIAEYPVG